jgi:hypothetical protein
MMHVASPLSTNIHNIRKDTRTFIVCTVDKDDNEYSMVWHCIVSLIGTECLAMDQPTIHGSPSWSSDWLPSLT